MPITGLKGAVFPGVPHANLCGELSVLSAVGTGGVLNISLVPDPSADLRKVEIYLNGQLIEPTITSGFDSISMDVSHMAPGPYELVVTGYDYYLNVASSPPTPVTLQ